MKYFLMLLSIFLFFFTTVNAQSKGRLAGRVSDIETGKPLAHASVKLLTSADSVLVAFTRVNDLGNFVFRPSTPGRYLISVSYPGYAEYINSLDTSSLMAGLIPEIRLNLLENILSEVIIKGKIPPLKVKGDTTEYNARAFKIEANAKVEDLLRLLPGIQVDQNGRITAFGQRVAKVLVDGEEFFGDDHTLITKNFRADMVDKIQLYDKKSDKSLLTGIDDGKKEKTINLQLKDDKRKGLFGKVDGGFASGKYYQLQGMLNKFSERQKFAIFGNISNTGKIALSGSDNNRYGYNDNSTDFVNGVLYSIGRSNDELSPGSGRYNGQGFPVAKTSGIHYDTKFDANKATINGNYVIGELEVDGERAINTINSLNAAVLNRNSTQQFKERTFRQKADVVYLRKFNASSSLKIGVDALVKNIRNNLSAQESNSLGDVNLLNQGSREAFSDKAQKLFNINGFYSNRLKKAGRSFSISFNYSLNDNNAFETLSASNNFYKQTGGLDSTVVLDQSKAINSINHVFATSATYSEPLSKVLSLSLEYGIGNSSGNYLREAFDRRVGDSNKERNLQFSNNLSSSQFFNQLSSSLNYKKDKASLNIGFRTLLMDVKQDEKITGSHYQRNFWNYNPKITYRYQFSPQQELRITYSGNTVQPTLDQLQPILNNTDPLYISVGNPFLKSGFNNAADLDFSSFKVATSRNLVLAISYSSTSSAIINNLSIDQSGKTTYQPINLIGHQVNSFLFRLNYSKNIKPINTFAGVNLSYTNGNNFSQINGTLEERRNENYLSGLYVSKNTKIFDFMLTGGPGYIKSTSNLPGQLTSEGLSLNGDGNFGIRWPKSMETRMNATYQYQSKTEVFDENFDMLLFNASISKRFLKKENLKLTVSANDLLNQNTGFRRNSSGALITQTTFSTIKRYFMFSLQWDFSKFGKTLQ